LDDSLAGAHALLGTISAAGDYDWAQAGEHFQQALQLDPASPEVSVPHAIWYLRPLGRLEEGLSELEGLRQRDPLSVIARTESAWMLLLMRRYDASAEMAKQALELDPNNCLTMYTLLQARVGQARHEEAILVAQRAVQVDGRWLVSLMYLAIAYAAASQSASARQVLGEMHQLASLVHTNATAFAAVYAALGEIDTAAEWVEKAIDQRAPLITTLKTWPIFDSIRFHPRYATLLQKLNLADPV
jgi:tetratricopeptide (TPR) repeat protein